MARTGVGASLVSIGANQRDQAMQMMGSAANIESQRDVFNQKMETSRKEGNQELGATVGAIAGTILGGGNPLGTMLGSTLGSIAGGFF